MDPKVNEKNTKTEILKAYEELMGKVTQQKKEEPRQIQEETKKQEIVKSAGSMSHETIVKGFASLKLELASTLEKLEEKLMSEFKHFEELQQAVAIEKVNLQNLYQITANSDSLAALLMAQKVKREEFESDLASKRATFEQQLVSDKLQLESEMLQKREQWKKEKALAELQAKEDAEALKKKREREEEEYSYSLQLLRKKEADSYQERKLKLEKELADKKTAFDTDIAARETKVQEAEAELKLLREKSETFPIEIEKAVKQAEKVLAERMQTQYKFETELTTRQNEGVIKLHEQTIQTLQSKIKDLDAIIKELTAKANTAEASVKDIAIKAIESSGKLQIFEKSKES
jgi:hypothetical protein